MTALSGADSIVDHLAHQAGLRGDRPSFTALPEKGGEPRRLSFAEMDHRARALAARLLQTAAPGGRAVLLFQPGLDMVLAILGCLAAGIVAVPLMLPRRAGARDASLAILDDCAPRLALTSRDVMANRQDMVDRFGAAFRWIEVDADLAPPADIPALRRPRREDLALLQYTSGSTSTPKGVMVTHGNLLANLEMIRAAMANTEHSTTLGWVPLFHDMGLVMQVMQPLYVGAHSVLMPPAAFMQRPLSWLRAISAHRAEVTCAPNFAFDLCVSRFRPDQMDGIDLSCLKVALNGAEPVHAATIERFAATFAPYGFDPAAMYPGYGLAEGTLLVSGFRRGDGASWQPVSRAALQDGRAVAPGPAPDADIQRAVACGRSLPGERVAIVDPERLTERQAGHVGEIWVSGPNVAQGYWQRPEATAAAFAARIAGAIDGAAWLRTGDLGFLDEAGGLYVTGRIKDVIVIRGANHYPQDIERTVQDAHPALRRDGGAAFSVLDEDGTERLVVVQEIDRTQRHGLDTEDVIACIRAAVATGHELALHDIALIRPSTLPKTTSGKTQRSLARRLWQDRALDLV